MIRRVGPTSLAATTRATATTIVAVTRRARQGPFKGPRTRRSAPKKGCKLGPKAASERVPRNLIFALILCCKYHMLLMDISCRLGYVTTDSLCVRSVGCSASPWLSNSIPEIPFRSREYNGSSVWPLTWTSQNVTVYWLLMACQTTPGQCWRSATRAYMWSSLLAARRGQFR